MTRAPRLPTRRQLNALARNDPALAAALRSTAPYPGFPTPARARQESHFGALGRAIVFQQLATKAASTIYRRFCALTPGSRFPTPPQVLAFDETAFASAGISRGKRLSLLDLAERVEGGAVRLHGIGRRDDDEIIEHLVTVRGIGVWSAQMFLIFRLGRLDVMPAGDLGVQEGLKRLDDLDERPAPDVVAGRGEAWAPLRTVAAWTLWRLSES